MPNALAFLALLAWPLVVVAMFKSLSPERAVIWSILGGYLLLPPLVNFDFPLIPPLDKVSIPNVAAYLACVAILGVRVPLWPTSPIGKLLMVMLVVSPVMTVLTNTDPIFFQTGGLPGLRIHDSIAATATQAAAILPFFMARRLLATEKAHKDILSALVVAGLAYSLPMLVEIRLSPQLNTWIYGFFQHDFQQMMRYGGFRPIVFLPHALWVAFFALMAKVSAAALWSVGPRADRGRNFVFTGYLAIVLVLCKSAASLVYAAFLLPLVRFAGVRTQVRIAAFLAAFAVLFPLLRGADLVPVDAIVERAERISPERAQSLAFRLENEDALLAKAAERPLFGWGIWGRNQIYDPITGKMLSVTDGRWIIVIGVLGWCGYIVEFGLLSLPLFALARASFGKTGKRLTPYCGPLALLLGVNMIDMLPNATLIPFTWILAGAILGYVESLKVAPEPAPAAEPGGPPAVAGRRTVL